MCLLLRATEAVLALFKSKSEMHWTQSEKVSSYCFMRGTVLALWKSMHCIIMERSIVIAFMSQLLNTVLVLLLVVKT